VSAPVREDGRRTRHTHRRRELLEAATDHVFETGLSDLTLRNLGSALGVSHRTLLYHFESREQLFSEVLKEARMRQRLLIAAQRESIDARGEGSAELLRATWERMVEHLPFFRVYYEIHGLALHRPERYRSFLDGVVTDWVWLIEGLLERDGLDPARGRAVATLIWAAVRGLQLDLLATGDRERVEEAFDELVNVVAATLGVGEVES
jgi:AcrR family transcriptional regulator